MDRDRANRLRLPADRAAVADQRAAALRLPPGAPHDAAVAAAQEKARALDALEQRLHAVDLPPAFLLELDAAGNGRAVVAVGNPDTARHVVTYVPGTGARLGGAPGDVVRADALVAAARFADPATSTAAVAWIGYHAPQSIVELDPTLGWLIALRVVQGLCAGLLVPAGQTLLGQAVGSARLGRVMSVLGIAVSFGPAFGPALSGIVLSWASWPWLFWLNIPIGALTFAAGWRLVPRGTPEPTGLPDPLGLALIVLGLPTTVYALTRWGELGRPALPEVVLPLAAGLLGLAAFVVRTRRVAARPGRSPVTDLGLFRGRVYSSAILTTTFTGAAMFGALLLLPLFFQLGRGAGVVETGLSLIAYSVGTAITVPLAGVLTDRYGGGLVAVIGAVATVATTVPFALVGLDVHPAALQALLLARGMAIGFIAVPPTVAAYAAVRTAQLPDATTQVNSVQRVGGAVGGALFAVVLAQNLPTDPATAVAESFWWLTGASAAALVAALTLWRAEHAAAADLVGGRMKVDQLRDLRTREAGRA